MVLPTFPDLAAWLWYSH